MKSLADEWRGRKMFNSDHFSVISEAKIALATFAAKNHIWNRTVYKKGYDI